MSKKFNVIVSSMSATYQGDRYGDSEEEVIQNLRAEYRRNNDSRAGWNIRAIEVD
jgi:hypothetical protein